MWEGGFDPAVSSAFPRDFMVELGAPEEKPTKSSQTNSVAGSGAGL